MPIRLRLEDLGRLAGEMKARAAAERVIDQDPSLAAHPQVLAALREQAPQALTWIQRS